MATSRRGLLKTATSAAAALAAADAALGATTQPATTPSGVSLADAAAADRLLNRPFSDEDRKLMADGVATYRARLTALRQRRIPPDVEPAVHFDPRLPGQPVPTGASGCTMSDAPTPAYDGNPTSLAFARVTTLSRLLHAKRISSVELTRTYLARLKEIGPRLNAVITLTEDLALAQAKRADAELAAGKSRGLLHGIPWGAKDLLAARGYPTTYGAAPYRNQVFDYDATVVRKLDEAGAVLCAKLSLGELAMGDVWYAGRTRTPWNPKEGSSGSSAGPCAAVAAGLVAFAIGSETMGSIISPCLVNGTTGLRPTYGRVSRYGAMALSNTMDKLGPITRAVEDAAIVLAAIAGPDEKDVTAANIPFLWNPTSDLKSLNVGYNPVAFEDAKKSKNPARAKAYADAFDAVRALVGDLKPVTLPPAAKYAGVAGTTIACESASNFSDLLMTGDIRQLRQQDAGSWPTTFRLGYTVPAPDYLRSQKLRTQLMRDMMQALSGLDLYLNIPYSGPTLAFTNLTGHPTLVARCGVVDGRPVLLEYVGNLYREDAILRLAFAYEQQTNWTTLWPDTAAIPPLEPEATKPAGG